MHGNAFYSFCRRLFQKLSFYFYYFILLLHVIIRATPRWPFLLSYKTYSANLVFRDAMTRPSLEDMLCVDLSYLIFRTCLALSKAMMVCMAKDLLAYTAAMAVGVINRKVIYMLVILFIECCF